MKTIITTLACAFVLSSTAFASDPTEDKKAQPLKVGAFATKDAKIQMAVRKGTAEKATIKLMDAKKNVLHQELMGKKSEKFDARFDISALPVGVYTIEIATATEKIQKQVSVTTEQKEETTERKIQLN
ncbi:MAG: hypothetical protein MUE30_17235 [Spirosomaceae bacterium]|jgi:hypothetical protein|nr:hypothetical protein [Spirosomataceae bacterium]